MSFPEARPRRVTRRVFISLASTAATIQGQDSGLTLASERVRYTDRATEMVLVRLTSPAFDTCLPVSPGRGISSRTGSMLVTVVREGRRSLVWLDRTTGTGRIVAAPLDLDPESVAMTADDRWIAYAAGQELTALQRQGARHQTLARFSPGTVLQAGLAASPDHLTFYFAESLAGGARIRSARLGAVSVAPLAECEEAVAELAPNPRRALLAWRTRGGALWLGGLDGRKPKRMETPGGRVLQFYWSRDGASTLYLFEPEDRSKLVQIREQQVDTRADELVAKTSQFASFAPNSNGTAFVGASRSKASPHILLLLRATQREFTLCEHGDPDPVVCRPVFTPDSQSVVFTSRMHGKSAVYIAGVEKLIEKTQD
ncbi:MAG TPA: hypothetical protein PKJ41_09655 [Bryobacteraceae bacterium]|nr:hypothetical protein [Bryobacteraceae bacterium]HPT26767.1 hypothetical protein [Bryobacteraceae bacterium]